MFPADVSERGYHDDEILSANQTQVKNKLKIKYEHHPLFILLHHPHKDRRCVDFRFGIIIIFTCILSIFAVSNSWGWISDSTTSNIIFVTLQYN